MVFRISGRTLSQALLSFLTVPQVIAYSFLAGMPPQAGYTVHFLPLYFTHFLDRQITAVGPTAIIAMMTLEVATCAESGVIPL